MWQLNLELFNIYKYDSECWGIGFLTCGLMERSLFSFHSDEDGWYLNLFWFIDFKIRDTRTIY